MLILRMLYILLINEDYSLHTFMLPYSLLKTVRQKNQTLKKSGSNILNNFNNAF